MNEIIARAAVELVPDTRQFSTALRTQVRGAMAGARQSFADVNKQVQRDVARTTTGVSKRFGDMRVGITRSVSGLGGVVAGAIGGAAVAGVLKSTITAASDLNETVSKTRVVFGTAAGPILAWSTTTSRALGISQQAALDAASSVAVFGKQAGLTGRPLAQFGRSLVARAADMASFSNTSPQEALEAIQAGLRGESEPLRRYGVLLDDASLRQEALKQRLISTTKQALTPQQRVLAAQALILRQTSLQQGDFARTSGGLANQQRILRAQLDDLRASLGQKLLPVGVKVVAWLNLMIGQMRDGVGTGGKVRRMLETVGAGLQTLFGWIRSNIRVIGPLVAGFAALNLVMAANPVSLVVLGIAALVTGLVTAYRRSAQFRDIVGKVADAGRRAFDTVREAVRKNEPQLRAIAAAIGTVFRWVAQRLGPILGWLARTQLRLVGTYIATTIRVIGGMVRAVQGLSAAVSTGAAWIGRKWGEIKTGGTRLLGWFRALPGNISRALGNTGILLLGKGRAVIQGLWNGLTERWEAVKKWVSGIGTWIKDHKGPVSLDARLLVPAGRAIMGGFLAGLKSGVGPAWDFVKSVGGKTVAALRAAIGGPFMGGGGPAPTNLSAMQALVRTLAAQRGWGSGAQWNALYHLVMGESGFNPNAQNPTSTAYGLFQFLNSTWASVGARKTSDPWAQTAAGLTYIARSYGDPLNAYRKWLSRSPHWYRQGTPWVPNNQLAYLHKGEAVIPAEINRLYAGQRSAVAAPRPGAGVTTVALSAEDRAMQRDLLVQLRRVADRPIVLNGKRLAEGLDTEANRRGQ